MGSQVNHHDSDRLWYAMATANQRGADGPAEFPRLGARRLLTATLPLERCVPDEKGF